MKDLPLVQIILSRYSSTVAANLPPSVRIVSFAVLESSEPFERMLLVALNRLFSKLALGLDVSVDVRGVDAFLSRETDANASPREEISEETMVTPKVSV